MTLGGGSTFEIESHGWMASCGSSKSSSRSLRMFCITTEPRSSRACSSLKASSAAAFLSPDRCVTWSSSASWMRLRRYKLFAEMVTPNADCCASCPAGAARSAGAAPSALRFCRISISSSSASRMSTGSAPPCSSRRTAVSIRARRRELGGASLSSSAFMRIASLDATSDASSPSASPAARLPTCASIESLRKGGLRGLSPLELEAEPFLDRA
mmetsp:Transcript_21184/g.48717  ORF Transcript_21184/g.48717 Transcript_21184/m.48717 type:complete len:213 (+) Transcript_21184:234-872(+)